MKVGKTGLVALGVQFLQIIIGIGTLAVLGRIISIQDFGLFAIILSLQAVFLPILDLGLTQAYLKLEFVKKEVGNVFFTVHTFIGLLISLIFLIISPLISYIFEDERLLDLLMVVSLSFLFTTLGNQSYAKLNRDLNFKLIYKINFFISVSSSCFVILLAYFGYGIWSLIYRLIFEALIKSILFILLSKDRYEFVGISIIKKYNKSLIFGINIVVSRLLSSWSGIIDKFVLAKLGSTEVLAVYTRSQQLAQMPHSNISMSLTAPALAFVARGSNFIDKYLLLYWVIFFTAGLPCIVLINFGDILLPLIMGPNWESMAWILQLMGFFGLGRVFQGVLIFFNINEKAPQKTNYFTIGYLIIIIIPSVLYFIIFDNLFFFIFYICIGSFVYWYTSLLFVTINIYTNFKKKIITLFLSQILITLSSIFIIYKFRIYLEYLEIFSLLAIGVSIQMIVVFIFTYILNKKIIYTLYGYLKNK